MIKLSVNGVPYTDFMRASLTVSIESLSNDFSFVATAVNLFPPFKSGDVVEVLINDKKRLTGHIEEISGSEQEGNHVITYSGRDNTGDFVDSSLVGLNDIRATGSLTLKKIIEAIIKNINSKLKVIDLFNPPPFNQAEDIVDAQDGTNALALALEYARKRQALLSSDKDGNIVITQSLPVRSGATLQRIANGANNILSQAWTIKQSERFNLYVHKGQLDPRALNFIGTSDIAAVENQSGRISNSDIRPGRQSVIVEPKGYSSGQLKNRAKWSSQIAKSKETRYNCITQDHFDPNGNEWIDNTLVQINSSVADITRQMLINTITFSQGEGEPTITSLEFVEKDVYTINQQILNQKPAGKQNDAFKSLGLS